LKPTDGALIDDPSVFDESLEIEVASVEELNMLSEPPPSIEFNVDAMLCFDGDLRKKLTGRDGAVKPGLKFIDLVDEFETAHKRPKKREATEPTLSDCVTALAT
jgi:hypothetical protein